MSLPNYTPGWRETKWSKVQCLGNQRDGPGLNPKPPDPELYMEERTCTLGRGFTNEVMLPNIPKATILKLSLAIHQTGIKC